ncbi:complex I NDUFA9 subunit family protein [Labrys wisconsinensis]|uniref:NADH dehydrogenase n=1 Tax=Labrys wisconsinensis TaxID=425677 RepID=A0ABU0IYU4_9HYPH|nr:complex I NDUFA9 subunit family protein [Labrys wisconsinensis]MDQ0467181.1 NADH dehydrogenase [Labrys wisconsinensis]
MVAVSDRLVTVFGGSGFIGRHAVRALARRGYRIRVAVRRPDLAQYLMTAGAVGQVTAVQANLRYPDSVEAAVEGADAVVNLVGIMHQRGRNSFEAAQAFGAGAVARAAKAAGAAALVHVSAIGADKASASAYAVSKAKGEEAVLAAFPQAAVLRPSVVFGPEDDFFNRFAAMAQISPVLPLIGGGETKFQPVFAGDVAEAIAAGVDGRLAPGTTYELGGPDVMSFREVLEFVLKVTQRSRILLPLPFGVAGLLARVAQYAPKPPLTPGQVTLLRSDNVVSAKAAAEKRTLEGIGIAPASAAAEVPAYLWRFRKAGQFEKITA